MGSSWDKIASYFPQKEKASVLLMGLAAAGKTTIMYTLKFGEVVTAIPTIGFGVETIEFKNIKMTACDLDGRDKIRPLCRYFYQNTSAIVFVVDSSDRERMSDASDELHRVANEDELRGRPVLVLANKQDLPNAMSVQEMREKLALDGLSQDRNCFVQPTIATQNRGLREGFEWLGAALLSKNTDILKPIKERVNN